MKAYIFGNTILILLISDHDFTACCIQEGVEEECLPFCSQIGVEQHIHNAELLANCRYKISVFRLARCALGMLSGMLKPIFYHHHASCANYNYNLGS